MDIFTAVINMSMISYVYNKHIYIYSLNVLTLFIDYTVILNYPSALLRHIIGYVSENVAKSSIYCFTAVLVSTMICLLHLENNSPKTAY